MHHPETETQATEDTSVNSCNISKIIKNTIGTIVLFGACLLVCHVFGWMPS